MKTVGGVIRSIGVPYGSRPPARHSHHFDNRIYPLENLVNKTTTIYTDYKLPFNLKSVRYPCVLFVCTVCTLEHMYILISNQFVKNCLCIESKIYFVAM